MSAACRPEELLIFTICRLLDDCRHVTTGMASPIAAAGALLRRELFDPSIRVSILARQKLHAFTDGGSEIFDLAARGRIDAFFLSGGQIDGAGNINLVGVGSYPEMDVRWSGSFGSAFLYYLVPKVILFRFEHTPRTLVEKVDFVSSPGTSPPNVKRPGGPYALLTERCLFMFQKDKGRFSLASVHPGESEQTIREQTAFAYDVSADLQETALPDDEVLAMIRQRVAPMLQDPYPEFVKTVFDA